MAGTFDSLGYYRKDRLENDLEYRGIDKIIPAYKGFDSRAWSYDRKEDGKTLDITIETVLIDPDNRILSELETFLNVHFPAIKIVSRINCLDTALRFLSDTRVDLTFLSIDPVHYKEHPFLLELKKINTEKILITRKESLGFNAFECHFSGFLRWPYEHMRFVELLDIIRRRIFQHKDYRKCREFLLRSRTRGAQEDTIGIPTHEGYEFIPINKIICCSGLQKYTDVISGGNKRIVSSYNIGEFRKMLQPYGFFAPHKSFLINLSRVVHYHKEGTLTMMDGHHIPLARRRKDSFLKTIKKDSRFPIIPQN